VSIAHRPETIYRANKVLRLQNGRLSDVTREFRPDSSWATEARERSAG
jgi:ABC-type transport system involved in cytochrome bd biosynthesis fused ATPase/permease subunit